MGEAHPALPKPRSPKEVETRTGTATAVVGFSAVYLPASLDPPSLLPSRRPDPSYACIADTPSGTIRVACVPASDHPLKAPVPTPLADLVPDAFDPEVAVAIDLDADGRFGFAWVGANTEQIVAVSAPATRIAVAMADVTDVRVDELFGASKLVAVQNEAEQVLARYSRNLVAELGVFARAVNDLREGRSVALPDEIDAAVCRRCGAPLPERGASCTSCLSRVNVLRRITKFLHPYRWRVAAMVAWSVLGVVTGMVPPLTYKMIADRVIEGGHHDELAGWVGVMLLASVVGSGSQLMTNWASAWISGRLIADMRSVLHARTQRLRLTYHQRHESGALVSRVMNDTRQLQQFLIDDVPYFLLNFLTFIAIGGVLFVLNWRLALLVFLPVPFLFGGSSRFWALFRPTIYKYSNRIGRLYTALSESIQGVRTVKSLAQEERRDGEFGRTNEQLFVVGLSLDRIVAAFFGSMGLTIAAGTVLVWYVGGLEIIGGREGTSLGTLLAFVGYMAMFYGPLQWFSNMFNRATTALTAAERIFGVMDQPEEGSATSASAPRVETSIRFERVRFSYERGREVLKGIDLEIRAGEMVGLVGRSGAGKSTIINLISRFYDPDNGAILVDGTDLREIDLSSWRSQVGMVMQRPFLFNASILDNIRYGAPDASFEKVVAAARAANAHDFISAKEDGYDTVVGDGGSSLSGGEQQRVAIARAILHNPRVLILDEATSAVDSETEKQIQDAIAHLIKGRTTIAIAHRLATLRNADRLVVLDDGRIVEQGTHAELMALEDGHFAKLVKLQTDINRLRAEQISWSET